MKVDNLHWFTKTWWLRIVVGLPDGHMSVLLGNSIWQQDIPTFPMSSVNKKYTHHYKRHHSLASQITTGYPTKSESVAGFWRPWFWLHEYSGWSSRFFQFAWLWITRPWLYPPFGSVWFSYIPSSTSISRWCSPVLGWFITNLTPV